MSTRASIMITDGHDSLWFYRHSDGYPESVLPDLAKFLGWVREGKVRNNVQQSAGWLVVMGHQEYAGDCDGPLWEPGTGKSFTSWKVGAYEPATGPAGDAAHVYLVNLSDLTVTLDGMLADLPDVPRETSPTLPDEDPRPDVEPEESFKVVGDHAEMIADLQRRVAAVEGNPNAFGEVRGQTAALLTAMAQVNEKVAFLEGQVKGLKARLTLIDGDKAPSRKKARSKGGTLPKVRL